MKLEFQEGFSNDTILVLLDGREVARAEAVSTDYAIGRAASANVAVAGGAALEISVPTKGVARRVPAELLGAAYLEIGLLDDQIELRPRDEPPTYF